VAPIQVAPDQPHEGAYYYDYYNVTTQVPDTVQPALCWTRTELRYGMLQACENFTAGELVSNTREALADAQIVQLFHALPSALRSVQCALCAVARLQCTTRQSHVLVSNESAPPQDGRSRRVEALL
jgi:hypothetical protein